MAWSVVLPDVVDATLTVVDVQPRSAHTEQPRHFGSAVNALALKLKSTSISRSSRT